MAKRDIAPKTACWNTCDDVEIFYAPRTGACLPRRNVIGRVRCHALAIVGLYFPKRALVTRARAGRFTAFMRLRMERTRLIQYAAAILAFVAFSADASAIVGPGKSPDAMTRRARRYRSSKVRQAERIIPARVARRAQGQRPI
jgi:hypothetical protein